MERKRKFIGIDFSKASFDATIHEGEHGKFSNDSKGYKEFLVWVEEHTPEVALENCLFCGENTGSYSLGLSNFLYVQGCRMWLESPLRIKRTMGLVRGKDDKVDSAHIARYAARNAEDAVAYEPCSEQIEELRKLFAKRQLYVSLRTSLLNADKEAKIVHKGTKSDKLIDRHNKAQVALLTKHIEELEERMLQLITADEQLSRQYRHITSIKGMGKVNAIALITVTEGFTRYARNAKKLACHAGVAPFKRESGTSVNGGVHVSHLSNRTLKPLLTQAALVAIRHNPNLSAYYQRLVEKGKNTQVALNNVKNKLLHIVIGLIRKDEDYCLHYQPMAAQPNTISEYNFI